MGAIADVSPPAGPTLFRAQTIMRGLFYAYNCSGISGRAQIGMGGRIAPESVDDLGRNMHGD